MTEPRPSVTRFAKAVARAELALGGGAHDSDVAQRIAMRLYEALRKLLGPAGIDVLLARSIVLARRAHPVLGGVVAGPGGTLAGLDDAGLQGPKLEAGAAAIIAHFIELLVVLIGEDLAMSLMRSI